MNTEQCTTGLRRMVMLAVGALMLSFAIGCGDADCEADEQLVQFNEEEICATACPEDGECEGDMECTDGFCLPADEENGGGDECSTNEDCDGDDICDDGECVDEGDVCQPQQVCETYCHEKFARCIEGQCEETTTMVENPETGEEEETVIDPEVIAEEEFNTCMEGLTLDDGEQVLQGCVEQAEQSDTACEQLESDAEDYAEQSCGEGEQEVRVCKELTSYKLTLGGEGILDSCGCSPAQSGADCSSDDDCDDYGWGSCVDGTCTADCADPFAPLAPFSPGLGDPTCAEGGNGMCVYWAELLDGQTVPGLPEDMCFATCSTTDDCDGSSSSCVGLLQNVDEEFIGFCDSSDGALLGDFFEEDPYCTADEDCDGHCFEGMCQPACDGEDDDDSCEQGDCVDYGDDGFFCEVDFADF